MATAQMERPVDNGVNVEALLGAQAALKDAPQASKFKWRSKVEWISGTHSPSTIEGFHGSGAQQALKKKVTFDADHPEVFAAEDRSALGESTAIDFPSCEYSANTASPRTRPAAGSGAASKLSGSSQVFGTPIAGEFSAVRGFPADAESSSSALCLPICALP